MFAGIIAFGVVYNSARVSLSERSRELASLRVLGFTRAEISMILLGELAVLTSWPCPSAPSSATGLATLIIAGFNNEIYRHVVRHVAADDRVGVSDGHRGGGACQAFSSGGGSISLDLVAVLKTQE